MTLPYDVARCPGIAHEGQVADDCEDCLRRTSPGHPTWQTMMAPPKIIVFDCPDRIGPKDLK